MVSKMIIKRAAISHSKHRNEFGLVGIEINTEIKKIRVKLARQWPRSEINEIPEQIGQLYSKIDWGVTYIDQLTGQHFIQSLRHDYKMPVVVINTQKNIKEPNEIEKIKTMDKVEMVQLMISIQQNHQIEFPPEPTDSMKELEAQITLFTEFKTEAGNVDYYSPGDEFDDLTKALLIACFSIRKHLGGDAGPSYVGPLLQESQERDPLREFEEAFSNYTSQIG